MSKCVIISNMSVLGKKWVVKNTGKHGSLMAKLLKNRGLEKEQDIRRFLYPSAEKDFHNPFLMNGMESALNRIGQAIEKSQRVMIFGDYDVDGITGTAILMRTLRKLGANVSCRLPHRIEDGYGLREKFVKEFHKLGVKLIVTVDNGISCLNEIKLANELGMDVIITDHHAVPEKIPDALCVLHPKLPNSTYPFAELTGAGVALKLAQALLLSRMRNPQEEIASLLDLACMGTVADIGELRGENRFIVKEGLRALENTRWPGLSRLKEYAGVNGKINTHDIGFLLSPRINAAGRISHPSHALRLLLHDEQHTHALAKNLELLNRKRQQMMDKLLGMAEKMTEALAHNPIIIIDHQDFHGGIIGLIAGRLAEKFYKPAIVMERRGELLAGSCRSVPGINMVKLLTQAENLLANFGGHAAAAGFEMKKEHLELFMEKMLNSELLANQKNAAPVLSIDCEIGQDEITEKNADVIILFEPFGAGNEAPKLLCRNIKPLDCKTVGKNKNHLKFTAALNGAAVDCIGFGLGGFADKLNNANSVDLVCELEKDEWNGNKKLQLKISDFSC